MYLLLRYLQSFRVEINPKHKLSMPFDSELRHPILTLKIIRLTSTGENKEFLNAEKYK